MLSLISKLSILELSGYAEYRGRDVFYNVENKHILSAEFIISCTGYKLRKDISNAKGENWMFSSEEGLPEDVKSSLIKEIKRKTDIWF